MYCNHQLYECVLPTAVVATGGARGFGGTAAVFASEAEERAMWHRRSTERLCTKQQNFKSKRLQFLLKRAAFMLFHHEGGNERGST